MPAQVSEIRTDACPLTLGFVGTLDAGNRNLLNLTLGIKGDAGIRTQKCFKERGLARSRET